MIKKLFILLAALFVLGMIAKPNGQSDAALQAAREEAALEAARDDSARRAAAERARFEAQVTRDRINDAFHDFRRDLFRR
jgi:hypothetical protein